MAGCGYRAERGNAALRRRAHARGHGRRRHGLHGRGSSVGPFGRSAAGPSSAGTPSRSFWTGIECPIAGVAERTRSKGVRMGDPTGGRLARIAPRPRLPAVTGWGAPRPEEESKDGIKWGKIGRSEKKFIVSRLFCLTRDALWGSLVTVAKWGAGEAGGRLPRSRAAQTVTRVRNAGQGRAGVPNKSGHDAGGRARGAGESALTAAPSCGNGRALQRRRG